MHGVPGRLVEHLAGRQVDRDIGRRDHVGKAIEPLLLQQQGAQRVARGQRPADDLLALGDEHALGRLLDPAQRDVGQAQVVAEPGVAGVCDTDCHEPILAYRDSLNRIVHSAERQRGRTKEGRCAPTRLGAGDQDRRDTSALLAWSYVALAVLLAQLLVALRNSEWAALPLTVVGVGSTALILVGRARNNPSSRLPWTLYAASCGVFILGAVLRQVLAGTDLAPLADVATLTGYGLVLAAFITMLRTRRGVRGGLHELLDGLIVVIAAGAVALVVFTLPTAMYGDLSALALLQGVYPVIDICVLFVILLLSWTSTNRVTSYWFLTGATLATLTGDLGYAYIGTQGHLVGSPLLDLPFVFGFAFLGAAALHPSMASLTDTQERPVQAWSRSRLALLVAAVLLPPTVVVGWARLERCDLDRRHQRRRS